MLETIGVESLDQLINETIPADIRLKNPLEIIMTEYEFANHIRLLGRTRFTNHRFGYHPTVPGGNSKKYFENPSWYTYTPPSRNCTGRLKPF
jgi:glycine dehydrogenase